MTVLLAKPMMQVFYDNVNITIGFNMCSYLYINILKRLVCILDNFYHGDIVVQNFELLMAKTIIHRFMAS